MQRRVLQKLRSAPLDPGMRRLLGRLAADAAHGVTGIVEHMHHSVLDTPGLAPFAQGLTGDVTRLVYRDVRGGFRLTGKGIGAAAALDGAEF